MVSNESGYKGSCGDDEEGCPGKAMEDIEAWWECWATESSKLLTLLGGHKQDTTTPLFIMASSAMSGIRSPASPRSGATSPRPNKFDSDQLKTYIKKLLASLLQNVAWPEFKERERGRALMKEIGDRVKERMLGTPYNRPRPRKVTDPLIEIEPRGLWVAIVSDSPL
jgi:hypothetical protein